MRTDGSDVEVAMRVIHASGVDVRTLPSRSEAYVRAYAEARLDAVRLDEWNPDQPRDEHGMFSSGEGTVAGALKSGQSAVANAETAADVNKLAGSVGKSKVLTSGAKAKLYTALAGKAEDIDPESDQAIEMKSQAFKAAIMGKENEDWADVEDPGTGDTVVAQLVDDGQGGVHAVLESGEVVAAPPGVVVAAKDAGEAKAKEALAAIDNSKITIPNEAIDLHNGDATEAIKDAMGKDVSIEYSEDGEQVTVTTPDGKVYAGSIGTDDDALNLQEVGGSAGAAKLASLMGEKDFDEMSGHQILSSPEYKSLNPMQKAHIDKLMEGDKAIGNQMDKFLSDNEAVKAGDELDLEEHDAATAAASLTHEEANPPANPNKTPEHAAHAKAARDAAKEAVLTGKALRAQLKKDPTNAQLKSHVEAAEKAAKAARSAARKAEKAKDAKEAAKHAAKAQEHADKVSQLNKSAPESGGPTVITAAQAAAAKPKASGAYVIPAATTKALQTKADKLKEAAKQPHPDSWSKEKIAAKEAAQKALIEHADPTTPDEMKAAADALEKVADQAHAAGSYWGSSYKSLAEEYRDAATPKEQHTFASGEGDDHSQPPAKSARPIADIKGELVTSKAHAEHRTQFTAALKPDEKKAALKYSGSAYGQINSHLRADGKPDKTMIDLDKAIAKAPAPKDMLVHRGISGSFSQKLYAGLKPGDQIVEKAYSSTSAGGNAAFGGDVEMHITVPKGYPAAPIPSHHPGEREYLLRRNTKFQVTKIENNGGKIIAHLTVVHDKQ